MLLRAFRTFWYQTVLCSDTGTLFIWEKLKIGFSKKSLQWSCSNQKTNIEYFHYIYRWTYHKNIIALIQRTVEIYYYPLRPLKWAKTQKLAPTAYFKGYDPTFWAKRHTITSRMISMVKKFYPKKPPCSSRSIPLKPSTSCGTPRPADILQENFCKQKDVKVYKEEKTSRIFKQQIVMM